MDGAEDGIPELTDTQRIRLRAAESDFTAMGDAVRNGTATPGDVEAAFARLYRWTSTRTRGATPCTSHPTPENTLRQSRRSCGASPMAEVAVSASTPAGTHW
ncbi:MULTISPECIES: hypothetical protein [unclassified Mycolicibacterium]|uniref:hypothetical protein n=1 Tax=unclassified Mycolicibacterium TaxID=2636767 RepID=UPI002ED8238B